MRWIAGIFLLTAHVCDAQTYSNVAFEQGIFVLVQGAYVGCGASFYDIDGDGYDDVTLCAPGNNITCFLNNGGNLNPAPFSIENSDEAKMPLWGDYDNDGDADLLITKANAQTTLYRNDGSWIFTDVTAEVGFPLDETMRSYGAAWGDYDRDGWLDLYICNYNFNGEITNYLLHNQGDGTFLQTQQALGVSNEVSPSFQPAFTDYNHDLWPDIYVINDKIHPNVLYHNHGDGTFEDFSAVTGSNLVIDAMSNSWCDFDHDGDLDIYVTNATAGNKFLINQNNQFFVESAAEYNLEVFSICWGATWMDYDLDGWEDLHVTSTYNGFAGNQNYFYPNTDGAFELNLLQSGFISDYHSSYSGARGDLNNDGYPDLLENNEFPDYATLWANSGGDNHYVKLTLEGVLSNRDGTGAWITAYVDGLQHHLFTQNGESYMSQHSQHRVIGLGQAELVDSLQVEWPSGHVEVWYDLPADQRHVLVEGMSLPPVIFGPDAPLCAGDSTLLTLANLEDPIWNTGMAASEIWVTEPGWYSAEGIGALGIQVQSDSVYVEWSQPAQIESVTSPVSCWGESDGQAWFYSPSGDYFSFNLFASETTVFQGLESGSYTYTFNNENNCLQTETVEITSPDELLIELLPSGLPPTQIQASATGGTPPYSYVWNTSETGAIFEVAGAGSYTCYVSDAFGCVGEASIEVEEWVGIQEQGTVFQLYPNPTVAAVNIQMPAAGTIAVYALDGRLILHQETPEMGEYLLEGIAPGTYLVQLKTTSQQASLKLVVQ